MYLQTNPLPSHSLLKSVRISDQASIVGGQEMLTKVDDHRNSGGHYGLAGAANLVHLAKFDKGETRIWPIAGHCAEGSW